jgi:hypothetical protein
MSVGTAIFLSCLLLGGLGALFASFVAAQKENTLYGWIFALVGLSLLTLSIMRFAALNQAGVL